VSPQPSPFSASSVWKPVQDGDGDTYYWNTVTNQTTYDKPAGFVDNTLPSAAASKTARDEEDDSQGWQEVKDNDGDTYYWNTVTNETTYDKPAGYGDTATEAANGEWRAVQDGDGDTYYWNTVTNETTYDKPGFR